VLAITREPFLAYSSNVFAMLGLRSLYFVLRGAVERVRYLRPALAAILMFVATKMLLDEVLHIGVGVSLAVIGGVLATAIAASRRWPSAQAFERV
jgi:tellurite resistance protein TerC